MYNAICDAVTLLYFLLGAVVRYGPIGTSIRIQEHIDIWIEVVLLGHCRTKCFRGHREIRVPHDGQSADNSDLQRGRNHRKIQGVSRYPEYPRSLQKIPELPTQLKTTRSRQGPNAESAEVSRREAERKNTCNRLWVSRPYGALYVL
jgi:hypothetical protein